MRTCTLVYDVCLVKTHFFKDTVTITIRIKNRRIIHIVVIPEKGFPFAFSKIRTRSLAF